jgi:hypothetical protein
VTRFEFSRNVSLQPNRCVACYYSIKLDAHRVTSMADTDIDAIRKRKKAEYAKQYRLKRKLLLQQQASTSTAKVNIHLPSLMMKVLNHLYVLGDTYTCHTYK